MVGRRGELAVAVAASDAAQHHVETMTGGDRETLWKNEVAPRALLPMARFKPSLDAPKVRAPVLVCAAAADRETPLENVRRLADLAPRGKLRVFPGTHFDFYLSPELRDRALEEQTLFLQEHLAAVA